MISIDRVVYILLRVYKILPSMETISVISGVVVDANSANTTIKKIMRDRITTTLQRHGIVDDSPNQETFQVVLNDASNALMAMLELRAVLKQLTHVHHPRGLDARVSIGLGDIEFMASTIRDSDGTAFQRSELGLQLLESRNNRLAICTGHEDRDSWLGIIARMLDRVVVGWSASQAAAIEYALQGYTQHQIADLLHITQPSVNNRLKLAHWAEIEHTMGVWRSSIHQWNEVWA